MLKQELDDQEKKLMKKDQIKTEDLKPLDKNKECFNMWMKEAESRERRQMQKQLTLLKITDPDEVKPKQPLIDFSPPLCPSFRAADLILTRTPHRTKKLQPHQQTLQHDLRPFQPVAQKRCPSKWRPDPCNRRARDAEQPSTSAPPLPEKTEEEQENLSCPML